MCVPGGAVTAQRSSVALLGWATQGIRMSKKNGMPIVIIRIDPKERNEEWEGDDQEGDDQEEHVGWESDDDDPLGNIGDLECTRNFSASIWEDSRRVGSLTATLIDRPSAFHMACDAESAELVQFGCLLCGSSGRPRHKALNSDPAAKAGGFLYIKDLNLPDPFSTQHALAFAMATHTRLGGRTSKKSLL